MEYINVLDETMFKSLNKRRIIIRFLQLILVAFIVLSGCSPQEEDASYIEDLKTRILR